MIYVLLPICLCYIALYYNSKNEYDHLKQQYLVLYTKLKKIEFPMGNNDESHFDNIDKEEKQ